MPQTVVVLLREYATCGKTRGVTFNTHGELRVINLEYWLLTELLLYGVKSLLLFLRPVPGNVLLCEVMEWMCIAKKSFMNLLWKLAKPMNARTSLSVVGIGQSFTAATLPGFIYTSLG